MNLETLLRNPWIQISTTEPLDFYYRTLGSKSPYIHPTLPYLPIKIFHTTPPHNVCRNVCKNFSPHKCLQKYITGYILIPLRDRPQYRYPQANSISMQKTSSLNPCLQTFSPHKCLQKFLTGYISKPLQDRPQYSYPQANSISMQELPG